MTADGRRKESVVMTTNRSGLSVEFLGNDVWYSKRDGVNRWPPGVD